MNLGRSSVSWCPSERRNNPPRVLNLDSLRVGVPQVDNAHEGVPLALLLLRRRLEPRKHHGVDRSRLVAEGRTERRRRGEGRRELFGVLCTQAEVEQLGSVTRSFSSRSRRRSSGSGNNRCSPDLLPRQENAFEQTLLPQVVVAPGETVDGIRSPGQVLVGQDGLLCEVGFANESCLALGF